jgi:hypothetical protein
VTATVIVCVLVVSAVAALFIGAWIRAGKQ